MYGTQYKCWRAWKIGRQKIEEGYHGTQNTTQQNTAKCVSLGLKGEARMPIRWYERNKSHNCLLIFVFAKVIYGFCFLSILHWQPSQGTMVNSQILNEISQCVETLNGVKEGRCKASLTFYRPNLRGYLFAFCHPFLFLFRHNNLIPDTVGH